MTDDFNRGDRVVFKGFGAKEIYRIGLKLTNNVVCLYGLTNPISTDKLCHLKELNEIFKSKA